MIIEYGFQANHSGYWWDSIISVTVTIDTFQGRPIIDEIPLRKERRGDAADPVLKMNFVKLLGYGDPAKNTRLLKLLTMIANHRRITGILNSAYPILKMPGVQAIKVTQYINGLEMSYPDGEVRFRISLDGPERIEIIVEKIDGNLSEIENILEELFSFICYPYFFGRTEDDEDMDAGAASSDSKNTGVSPVCTLAPRNCHSSLFGDVYYVSAEEIERFTVVLEDLEDRASRFDSALYGSGWTPKTALDLALKMDRFLGSRGWSREKQQLLDTCRKRFWQAAGKLGLLYLTRRCNNANYARVLDLLSLCTLPSHGRRAEVVPALVEFFGKQLQAEHVEFKLLDLIAGFDLKHVVPDLCTLIEKNLMGEWTGPHRYDISSWFYDVCEITGQVVRTLRILLPKGSFIAFCRSCYEEKSSDTVDGPVFSRPFLEPKTRKSFIDERIEKERENGTMFMEEYKRERYEEMLDKLHESIVYELESAEAGETLDVIPRITGLKHDTD